MKVLARIPETREFISELKSAKGSLGFVPTMGALHEGHLSLIRRSLRENPATAVSIFVNPTQFNEKRDFESYPRDMESDLSMIRRLSADLVFAPTPEEVYPEPDERVFDFGGLDQEMEGRHRPGHFRGVAQVVIRLFEIIGPDKAYFGEKDFQQLAIIRKVTGDLGLPVGIIPCPIIREKDGLAMSSRNQLLKGPERLSASRIYRSLILAKEQAGKMPAADLSEKMIRFLEEDKRISAEYFQIVDAASLRPIKNWTDPGEKRACIAARIGRVRLIDNMDFSF